MRFSPSTIFFGWWTASSLQPLQYFPLTQLQFQPPATSQATVFFSHTTPAPASSSSVPNTAEESFRLILASRCIHYLWLWTNVRIRTVDACTLRSDRSD